MCESRPLSIHHLAIKHPVLTLLFACLVVVVAAPGALKLELRTDGHALVPQHADAIGYDKEVREAFDIRDPIVILIRTGSPDGVFEAPVLRYIQTLARTVADLYDIPSQHVVSLDSEHGHRVRRGTLRFRRFLEPLPESQGQLFTLRDDLEKLGIYTGTIISDDGSAASIFVGVAPDADRFEVYAHLHRLIAELELGVAQKNRINVDIIGAPVAETLLGSHILADLGLPKSLVGLDVARSRPGIEANDGSENVDSGLKSEMSDDSWTRYIPNHVGLVPIAMFIMACVFAVAFRSVSAAMLPLMEVGACLVVTFGLMGYWGSPVYLTIAVMPIILTAVGVADEIHIFTRYRQNLKGVREDFARAGGEGGGWRDDGHIAILRRTMDELRLPLIQTSVTASVGFSSFCLSSLPAVRAFGVFTAFGILFCLFWSLTVIPALLALIPPRYLGVSRTGGSQSPRVRAAFLGLASLATDRPRTILTVSVLAIALAVANIPRMRVQDSWVNGFAPESSFRQATEWFNEHFLGGHILLLHIQAPRLVVRGTVSVEELDHRGVSLPAGAFDGVGDAADFVGHWLQFRPGGDQAVVQVGPDGTSIPVDPLVWRARIESVHTGDDDEGAGGDHRIFIKTERSYGSPVLSLEAWACDVVEYELETRPMTVPEVVRRIGALEDFVADQTDLTVGGVLGTAAYAKTTHFISKGLKDGSRIVPDDPDRLQWVWDQYARIRSDERLGQLISSDYAESLVTVYLKDANFRDVATLMEAIRDYEAKHLAPHQMSVGFAGDVAVSQTLIGAIVSTQLRSLTASLIGILIVTTLLSRGLRWGVLSVIPCAVALIFNFAAMGFFGIPLGVATSMFAGMTLGIGVDYAIHTIARYRVAFEASGDPKQAVEEALTAKGPAILIDALSVSLGFGVLIFSQVPANARLGILLVTSLFGCLLATFLLLPALLVLFPGRDRSPR